MTFTDLILVTVRARPAGLWTLVSEFVDKAHVLKISAPNTTCWSYADAIEARCGPDGDPDALLSPAKCLVPSAPVGALVGKIGGSISGAADGQTFVVGSYCVVSVAAPGGPLYLTINDEAAGMGNNAGAVDVKIQIADLPEKPPAPSPSYAVVVSCATSDAEKPNPRGS